MARSRITGLVAGVAAAGAGLALFSRWQGKRAEAQAPPDGAFVDVPGGRLHYVSKGEGSPVVMVHGLGGQLRNFAYGVADQVARRHRVVLIDRPRSGYSTVDAGAEPGVAQQAAMIAAAIAALGLERPLFVGHSLGGALGLALALDHPGAVRALALVAPLTLPQPRPPAVFRNLTIGGASRAARLATAYLVGTPLGKLTAPATLKQVFAPEEPPADFATRGGGALALRPGNLAAAMFEMVHASDEMAALRPRYGELALPVAILFGRGDHVLDHRHDGEQGAREIPRCRLDWSRAGTCSP